MKFEEFTKWIAELKEKNDTTHPAKKPDHHEKVVSAIKRGSDVLLREMPGRYDPDLFQSNNNGSMHTFWQIFVDDYSAGDIVTGLGHTRSSLPMALLAIHGLVEENDALKKEIALLKDRVDHIEGQMHE